MSRLFDIVVYGATGLAGKHVVMHLLKNHPQIKLAIAGRNETKLLKLASELNKGHGGDHGNDDKQEKYICTNQILIASADNKQELIHILQQTKMVLACAGPYRHVGKNIVAAAIETQTDYLDLCGEPQFFDDMLTSYDAKARESNTIVLSACAFDCVPAEMMYRLASKELLKKYNNETPVTNVEVVHTFQGIKRVNKTTFDAAVDGFYAFSNGELKSSRDKVKECFPQLKDKEFSNREKPKEWKKFISTPGLTSPLYHEYSDTYTLKFLGADAACILASDRYSRLRSDGKVPIMPYFSVGFGLKQRSDAYQFLGFGAVFAALAKWSWGCKILHSNPELFTKGYFTEGGPTEEEMKDAKFVTYGTAYGLDKDQNVRVKFSGPEPGYIATSAIMSALALTVLNHRDSIKYKGGVMLPGAAFHDCDFVYEYLKQEGMEIEIDQSSGNNSDEKV